MDLNKVALILSAPIKGRYATGCHRRSSACRSRVEVNGNWIAVVLSKERLSWLPARDAAECGNEKAKVDRHVSTLLGSWSDVVTQYPKIEMHGIMIDERKAKIKT